MKTVFFCILTIVAVDMIVDTNPLFDNLVFGLMAILGLVGMVHHSLKPTGE